MTATVAGRPLVVHRLIAAAAVGAITGVLLGAVGLIFCPAPVGTPAAHSVALGRAFLFFVLIAITSAVGILGGLLSLLASKWPRAAQAVFAVVMWSWLVVFAIEVTYRRVLGVRPTRSLSRHIATHLGPYLELLPRSLLIGGAVGFVLLIGVSLLLARLATKIAERARSIRPLIAGTVVGLVGLMAVLIGKPPTDTFWMWIQSGTPVIAFGVGEWTEGREFATIPITPGPVLGTPDAPPSAPPAKRPNVLLIVLESININQMGYGGRAVRQVTPNIDKLAASSRRMRRVWSVAPLTNLAVSAVLSSTLPRRRWGFELFTNTDYPRETLFSVFNREGFDTASIASDDQDAFGLRPFLAPAAAKLMLQAKDFPGEHFHYGEDRSADDREVVSRAIEWMSGRPDPWMLYVNLQRTHVPYRLPAGLPYPYLPADQPPNFVHPGDQLESVRNRYDAVLGFVDAQVGRLLAALAETKGAENTLVVLLADHGDAFGEHGIFTHARTVYESEIRVPLLFHWPGHIEPGDDDTLVSLIDIAPTILSLAGGPLPAAMQGSNAFDGHSDGRPIFLEVQAMGDQDGIVCWPWKLMVDRNGGDVHLFDLAKDPEELDDQALGRPALTASLRVVLEGMATAQVDYYEKGDAHVRYPPRLPRCPAL